METPQTIGKYEILGRIGKGGFGVVYKGLDPFIKRLVAIKLCTSADETLQRRFLREAEIAGNLHHRNIVTVFELGHDETGPYLVQEYLDGEDLETKIRRTDPIPRPVRLGYLLQIARALDYAHRKGILHRDVKPGNVRILEDERVKLLDFGIAKLAGAETQLTRTGRILGTAGYLAPEQIKGEPVDARSDVFSFGVLAYELLTHVHPFPGTTLSELLHQVVRSEPEPITSVWPACPPELADLVGRCLEKDPQRRPATFAGVAEALSPAMVELQSAPEVPLPEGPEETEGGGRPAASSEGSAGSEGSEGTSMLRPRPFRAPTAPAPEGEPADLEATQVVQPETPTTGAGRWPWRSIPRESRRLALVLLILVVVGPVTVAALWIGVGRWLHSVRAPEEPPAQSLGAPAAESGGAPVQGVLVVEAVPWAEVVRVTGPDGDTVPLPAERSTPLALPVSPGSYTVELAHPEAPEPAVCRAEVTGSGIARCAARFPAMEPLEYFSEAGWWR